MLGLSPGLTAYLLTLTALLGLVMGSFVNCWAWRLARGQSVLRGRSRCAHCGCTLGAADLIPVLSWLLLKGRCRRCGEKISPRYPAVELLTMGMFLALALRYDLSLEALRLSALCCLLLGAALVDLDVMLLPDGLLAAAAAWYLLSLPLVSSAPLSALLDGLKGGALVAGPLLALVLLADRITGRESMGGGDIKLLFVTGLYLGLPVNLLNLILSCLLGVALGLGLRRAGRQAAPFPFGPAVVGATFLCLLFGQAAVDWYLRLFF